MDSSRRVAPSHACLLPFFPTMCLLIKNLDLSNQKKKQLARSKKSKTNVIWSKKIGVICISIRMGKSRKKVLQKELLIPPICISLKKV